MFCESFTFVVITYIFIQGKCFAQQSLCQEDIIGFVLEKDYNRNHPTSHNTMVEINYMLHKINEVNDKQQEVDITLTRTVKWKDPRIQLNKSHPFWSSTLYSNGIKSVRLNEEFVEKCLWIPKLHLLGHPSEMKLYRPLPPTLDNSPMEATFNEDGRIMLIVLQLQITHYSHMDFLKYPFDEQICTFGELLDRNEHEDEINYKIEGGFNYDKIKDGLFLNITGDDLRYHLTSKPSLSNKKRLKIQGTQYPMFSCEIKMKRRLPPYFPKLFGPMAFLVKLSWISFLIAPKMVLGCGGLLLSLCLVLTNFFIYEQEFSPSISGITPLMVWTNICMSMCVLAFIEHSYLLYCMRFSSKRYRKIAHRITSSNISVEKMKLTPERNITNGPMNNEEGEDTLDFQNWSKKVDTYAIKIFPLSFLVVSVIYWVYFGFLY